MGSGRRFAKRSTLVLLPIFIACTATEVVAGGSTEFFSAQPLQGPTAGGTVITIRGANLPTNVDSIFFGGVPVPTFNRESDTLGTVTTPPHPAGNAPITVKLVDGTRYENIFNFFYNAPPVLSGITPTFGSLAGGTTVTVSGSAISPLASVAIAGVSATNVTATSTSVTATTPAVTSPSVANVVVTNPDGQSDTVQFTYQGAPVVTGISPSSGSTAGGSNITIGGSGLSGVTIVRIGAANATNVVATNSQITARSPAGTVGVRDVIVQRPDGAADTLPAAYTYVSAPAPTLSSLSRDVASTAGGSALRLLGTNFEPAATVSIGGTNATVVFVSSSELRVTVPAHAAGVVSVSVSQPGGTSTLTNRFEYLPAPTVTYVGTDFEGGTLGGFSSIANNGGDVTVGQWGPGFSVSGTRSVRSRAVGGSVGAAGLSFNYGPPQQQPALTSTGLYQRWYVRMDQATMNAVQASGQIKLLLNRQRNGPGASWLHVGYGAEFPRTPKTRIKVLLDYNTELPPNGQHDTFFEPLADTWFEIQTHFIRSGGVGRARMWINGKLALDVSDPNFGTDANTNDMNWAFALDYTQNSQAIPFLVMYVDDARAANGYIDPVPVP